MAKKHKIIFFGSPAFARVVLQRFLDESFNIDAVVTQPDRSRGRGKKRLPTPVKELAKKEGIYTYTPKNPKQLSDLESKLKRRKPDLFVVASYGMIIPKNLLDIPEKGALNVHPSLLPKYRGATPIQKTILEGDEETGVTIILMDEEMDHGPIVAQKEIPVPEDATTPTLTAKLAHFGAQLLIETIPRFVKGKITPKPQDHEKATYTKKLKKEDGEINWVGMSNRRIERMIRAYNPWPGVWTTVGDMAEQLEQEVKTKKHKKLRLKLLEAHIESGVLALDRVQVEGKNPISFSEFVRGYLE